VGGGLFDPPPNEGKANASIFGGVLAACIVKQTLLRRDVRRLAARARRAYALSRMSMPMDSDTPLSGSGIPNNLGGHSRSGVAPTMLRLSRHQWLQRTQRNTAEQVNN